MNGCLRKHITIATKMKVASTMMLKLVKCQANFINNVKWTKTLLTQMNMETFEEKKTKSLRTKVAASREEREAVYCLESASNSRTTFHKFSKSNKWLARRAGALITGYNRSTIQLINIHQTLQTRRNFIA
jgi:hypothetical protein